MRTRLRDIAVTLGVLLLLFGLLLAINPRVRERFAQLTGEVQSHRWNAAEGPMGIARAVFVISSDYAADNPILFSFVVVAAVLFVLMLRT